MILILLAFVLIISISFICSLCEAVLLSLSPAFVEVAVDKRPKAGKVLKHIMDNMDR